MVSGETVVQHLWGSEISTKICIGNHMILSAIWNK